MIQLNAVQQALGSQLFHQLNVVVYSRMRQHHNAAALPPQLQKLAAIGVAESKADAALLNRAKQLLVYAAVHAVGQAVFHQGAHHIGLVQCALAVLGIGHGILAAKLRAALLQKLHTLLQRISAALGHSVTVGLQRFTLTWPVAQNMHLAAAHIVVARKLHARDQANAV